MKIKVSHELRGAAFKHFIAGLGGYEAVASYTGLPTVTHMLRGDSAGHDGWKYMNWPRRILAGGLTALIGAHLLLGYPRGEKPAEPIE